MKQSQRWWRAIGLTWRLEETSAWEGTLGPWKGTGRKRKSQQWIERESWWWGAHRHAEGERQWMRAIDKEGKRGQGWGEGEREGGRRDQKVFTHRDSRIKLRREKVAARMHLTYWLKCRVEPRRLWHSNIFVSLKLHVFPQMKSPQQPADRSLQWSLEKSFP